ncbi:MAG: FadR/GntR family transcriptional regulator [Hyphomicrobiaceae bacterium]
MSKSKIVKISEHNTNAVFDPINHGSVVDHVVDQIETMIVTGILKEGRKLPPEREMADVLQVSRPKLREALKRLEADDLIVVRHGGGTFVGPLVGKAMSPALTELYSRHQGAFFDYLEYRREQEGFAAALAAERATDIDCEIIADILVEMDRAHETNDRKAAQKADMNFHTAIVDSSHNTTLIHMMASIYDLTQKAIFYNRDYLHTLENSAERLLEQHHKIAQAIFDRDPKGAKKAAHDHLDYVERSVRRGYEVAKRKKTSSKMKLMSKNAS